MTAISLKYKICDKGTIIFANKQIKSTYLLKFLQINHALLSLHPPKWFEQKFAEAVGFGGADLEELFLSIAMRG